jgi:hypothetical protein
MLTINQRLGVRPWQVRNSWQGDVPDSAPGSVEGPGASQRDHADCAPPPDAALRHALEPALNAFAITFARRIVPSGLN